jgi:hypothetical protein
MTIEDRRDAMMGRIQALLAQADHEGTGELEAATFRQRAEELMAKYRIEESQLNMDATSAPLTVPVSRMVPLYVYGSPFADTYLTLAGEIMYHVGARAVTRVKNHDGQLMVMLEAVGYETDLRYLELLYTAARTYFAARMEPKVRPEDSDADNVYRLRSAGVERRRIAIMMGWDTTEKGTNGAAHGKVTKLYKEACEQRGEDPKLVGRTVSAKTFREAFSTQFPVTLANRLRVARDGVDSTGGAVVLANRCGGGLLRQVPAPASGAG